MACPIPQQSIEDVGAELTQVRGELTQLIEVIQSKDMEIENLEQKLQTASSDLGKK